MGTKTTTRLLYCLCFIAVSSSISSCRWFDPEEDIPAFVQIDALTLTAGTGNGSSSEKISEVWVFADGETIGAYDLPATVPVLREGPVSFSFRAGIKNNGISSSRILYPFYTPYDITVDLVPGETVTVMPEFTYVESTFIVSDEDFESVGSVYQDGDIAQVEFQVTELVDEVFEGNHSGKVVIEGEGVTYWQGVSIDNFPLPSGKLVFAEMNYKANNNFAVGLFAWRDGIPEKNLVLIINPTTDENGVEQWNKIYIDLTNTAASNITADDFQLYIEANRQGDVDQAEILFDNIKILHFE